MESVFPDSDRSRNDLNIRLVSEANDLTLVQVDASGTCKLLYFPSLFRVEVGLTGNLPHAISHLSEVPSAFFLPIGF